jgi:MscS family membrane protein
MVRLLESIPVSPLLQKLIGVAVIILGTLALAYFVRFMLIGVASRIAARTRTDLDDRLVAGTKRQLFFLIILFGLSALFEYLQAILVDSLGPKLFEIIDAVLYAVGVILVANILVRIFSAIFRWYGSAVASRTETQVDDEFIPLLDRATKVVIYVLATLIILDHFHIDIKGLITVLGVGSLAIALAAQETIANMIGGFVIMIDRPFRVGDWLRLSDGTTSRVHQIGVRSTKFLTLENTLIIVPNAELMKSTVHNITYPHPEVRLTVSVGVSYSSDMEKVKRVMLDEAAKNPVVLNEPEPFFRFEEFADSSLNVSLYCRVSGVLDQYRAGTELREQILNRFRMEGIEIPFPQRVVTMLPGQKGPTSDFDS